MANLSLVYWLKDLSKKGNLLAPDEETDLFFEPRLPREQGLEGYFRDSGFDQNTVRESGKRLIYWRDPGFDCSPGSGTRQKLGTGCGIYVCVSVGNAGNPLKTRVNSKYRSTGSTYILHLLAFVEIRLFNVFFWERKAVFGKLNTWGMRDSREKGDPRFQTLREGLEGLAKVTSVDFRQLPDPKQHT